MTRTVLAVGLEIPGDGAEEVSILSDRSLLDADLIIFNPEIPKLYGTTSHQGKRCLDDDDSFQLKEAIAHWRRELAAAIEVGKTIVLMLAAPETIYVATGRKEYSGTGRNARATRIVEPVTTYDMVPLPWKYHAASGSEMVLHSDARALAEYWRQFEQHSEYRLFLEDVKETPAIKTKSGNRAVGVISPKGKGLLIALPPVMFDDEAFTEMREENGRDVEYWSDRGESFGSALIAELVRVSDQLSRESAQTPAPEWTRADQYRMAEESTLEASISTISEKLVALDEERRSLKKRLDEAGSLRRLLYAQGSDLESAILESLRLMGFNAAPFRKDGSEFDAVFLSEEGRFIGEAEGKDNRPVNIDKFSQLERNLNEDFAREEVEAFAKGVLFGNAFRLRPISERQTAFTEKCFAAAKRLSAALVRTSDMFEPARYLQESHDHEYAAGCRNAILTTSGEIVRFPPVPTLGSEMRTRVAT
jgi:hypothetical protein